MTDKQPLLKVRDLCTYFYTEEGIVYALDDVSFDVARGQTLGIVGESGSGKSVTALSIMRLVQSPPGRIVSGTVELLGEDILKKSRKEMKQIRGGKIGMIFQEPMTSLNPVYTVGNQIMESILLHSDCNRKQAKERAIEMLRLVGIPLPEKRFGEYPHQLSGGMRQRVMIAIALSCNPQLLICDEPTTALDVTIQAQILELINDLKQQTGASVIMITHDLGVISRVADEVMVMYAGKAMEYGAARDVFTQPRHPYTAALLKSIPNLEEDVERLHVIEGMVPSLSKRPQGCLFHPRCKQAMTVCQEKRPALTTAPDGRRVRCFLHSDAVEKEAAHG
ncbi:MAG: ABC transporter ATP-binding protein [Clostridiales bacterium]|nr:ABC transporter ATP-binding protein [Clostridiales bacterium]